MRLLDRQSSSGNAVPAVEAEPLPATVARGPLTKTELRRRLWHMGPGLLPFVLWPVPHPDPLSPDLMAVMAIVGLVIGGSIFTHYRRIQRNAGDRDRLWAVLGYAVPVLATLLLLPGDAEVGLAVLGILAFGDGSATLGGLLLGGPKLPWNGLKTWSGLVCFVAGGTAMATLIYWAESNSPYGRDPGASFLTSLLCAGGAALASAIAESIPARINDNVRVGVTAAVVMTLLHRLLVR